MSTYVRLQGTKDTSLPIQGERNRRHNEGNIKKIERFILLSYGARHFGGLCRFNQYKSKNGAIFGAFIFSILN